MKVKELLTDKTKWIKGYYAVNKAGDFVSQHSDEATCWCLVGAIYRCYPGVGREHVLDTVHSRIGNITIWNDSTERTFQNIKDLVNSLDI